MILNGAVAVSGYGSVECGIGVVTDWLFGGGDGAGGHVRIDLNRHGFRVNRAALVGGRSAILSGGGEVARVIACAVSGIVNVSPGVVIQNLPLVGDGSVAAGSYSGFQRNGAIVADGCCGSIDGAGSQFGINGDGDGFGFLGDATAGIHSAEGGCNGEIVGGVVLVVGVLNVRPVVIAALALPLIGVRAVSASCH